MVPFPLGLSATSLAGVSQKQVSLAMHSSETQVTYIHQARKGHIQLPSWTRNQSYIQNDLSKEKDCPSFLCMYSVMFDSLQPYGL